MGKGASTQITRYLLLDPRGVAVSLSTVALQSPLVGQLLGAQRTLLLALLGHGAAFGVGHHATLVGETLLTPATGVGLGGGARGGGGRRGVVGGSVRFFLVLFRLLFDVLFFSLFLLLVFVAVPVLLF